jgi:hypothetical protein
LATPAAPAGAREEGVVDMIGCAYALNNGQNRREKHANPYLLAR